MESNTNTFSVQEISAEDTLPLRQAILRPGGTREDCLFDGDTAYGTFHLGCFSADGDLACVASFYPRRHHLIFAADPYQLRGMATSKNWQGRGAGHFLLQAAIAKLKNNGADLIWCNARQIAVDFYKKHGFETRGEVFEIAGIGPHLMMFRDLHPGKEE